MSVYPEHRLVIASKSLWIRRPLYPFQSLPIATALIVSLLGRFATKSLCTSLHHIWVATCFCDSLLDSWYAGPWVSVLFWQWRWRGFHRLVCAVVTLIELGLCQSASFWISRHFVQILSRKMVWTDRMMRWIWISKNKRRSWRSCWIRLHFLSPTDLNLLV